MYDILLPPGIKQLKKNVLKNPILQIFVHLCLQLATLLKRDSSAGAFMGILRSFSD